ncbi:hypothetical protein G3T18_23855 [Oscillatoria salina IIICB1]|nr:hypothetical protein [Oscillatoria salina IIICB1]NET91265.1 hypothetical protein [Kamptonema sp. SIO1D9]
MQRCSSNNASRGRCSTPIQKTCKMQWNGWFSSLVQECDRELTVIGNKLKISAFCQYVQI